MISPTPQASPPAMFSVFYIKDFLVWHYQCGLPSSFIHMQRRVWVTYKSSCKVNMPINFDNFMKGTYLAVFRSDNNTLTFSHHRLAQTWFWVSYTSVTAVITWLLNSWTLKACTLIFILSKTLISPPLKEGTHRSHLTAIFQKHQNLKTGSASPKESSEKYNEKKSIRKQKIFFH